MLTSESLQGGCVVRYQKKIVAIRDDVSVSWKPAQPYLQMIDLVRFVAKEVTQPQMDQSDRVEVPVNVELSSKPSEFFK